MKYNFRRNYSESFLYKTVKLLFYKVPIFIGITFLVYLTSNFLLWVFDSKISQNKKEKYIKIKKWTFLCFLLFSIVFVLFWLGVFALG